MIVQPRTVIAWQQRRFRNHWTRLCRSGKPGRPPVAKEVRVLIRRLSAASPLWGAPRIVHELAKMGISVTKATVEKYMVRRRGTASPTWMTPLRTHVGGRQAGGIVWRRRCRAGAASHLAGQQDVHLGAERASENQCWTPTNALDTLVWHDVSRLQYNRRS